MMKRIISLLLALVLLVGMLPPVDVRASEEEEILETTVPETSAPEQAAEETETAAPETTVPVETEAAAKETAQAEETEPAETELEVSEEAAYAHSGTGDDGLYWELDNNGVLTISGSGEMWDCDWVNLMSQIYEVVIEDGITSIVAGAFAVCQNLMRVTIPDSVTYISYNAFTSCSSLSDIVIPESVTEIGDDAFAYCSSLTQVNLPSGISYIAEGLFESCTNLKTVTIPAGVTSIGDGAFFGTGITEITIPEAVSTIADSAFSDCSSLRAIAVEAGNENYCDIDGVLYNKSGTILQCCPGGRQGAYEIPEGTQRIAANAFNGCGQLTSVTIPESVISINAGAFESCRDLESVMFLGDAPSIAGTAFNYTTVTAYYPANNSTWTSAKRQNYGGTITWEPYSNTYTSLTVERLPEKLGYLVDDEIDLTGLVLRASNQDGITRLISDLEDIQLVSGDTSATGRRTVQVEWNGLTAQFQIGVHRQVYALQPSSGYPESSHDYGNNMDRRWEYTVPGAAYLELTFSDQTETESEYDYIYIYDAEENQIGCYDGTDLAGQMVTVDGDTAIIRMTTDSSDVRYGFSLESIYAMGLAHEPSGQGVYTEPSCYTDGYYTHTCSICDMSYVQADEGSARHTYADGECTVCGRPENALDLGTVDNLQWVLSEDYCLIITGSGEVPAEGPWAEYKSEIQQLDIREGITAIADHAFDDYDGLIFVTIADSVVTLGDGTFYECSNLESIRLPANITSIPYDTFSECSKLRDALIPAGVTKIGEWAFNNCYALTSVVLPASLEIIEYNGFNSCTGLTTVRFLGDAPEIDEEAFGSVEANVYYPANNSTWTSDDMQDYSGSLTWKVWREAVSVELQTPPANAACCKVGDRTIDLTGLELLAKDAEGNSWIVTPADGITVTELDTSSVGQKTVTVAYEGFTVRFQIYVHRNVGRVLQPSSGYPASGVYIWHNMDKRWEYSVPGAGYLELTFSADTATENDYDFIYIYDAAGKELGKYCGTELAGRTVTVNGDAVTIRMTTDGSERSNGFSLDSIYAYIAGHEASGNGVYTEPGCEHDGYDTHTCSICGAAFREWNANTAGHRYVDGFCSLCSMPENAALYGEFGDICWAIDETDHLFVWGSGEIDWEGRDEGENVPWYEYREQVVALTIREGVTGIGADAFKELCQMTSVSIPGTVTRIGNSAFYHCESLTEVTIPYGVTEIAESVFADCYALTDVTIPYGITEIAEGAFGYCPALTNVTIPDSVVRIGDVAFYSCSALTNVTIPDSVVRIGDAAFYSCSALTNVTIPYSVTEIGEYAFGECYGMETIRFEGDAPYIVETAFADTTVTAYYPAGNPTWTEDVFQNYGGDITWEEYELPQITIEGPAVVNSGSSVQLNARFSYAPAAGTEVTWRLAGDGDTYATLTPNGNSVTVTALRVEEPVTVTITASATGRAMMGQFTLTIEPVRIMTESLSIYQIYYDANNQPVWYELEQGSQWYYWLEGWMANGFSVLLAAVAAPEDAQAWVQWTSSDPTVATIDAETGTAYFSGKPGKVVFTATATDGSGVSAWVEFETRAVLVPTGPQEIDLLAGKAETLKIKNQKTGKVVADKDILWTIDAGGEDPEAFVTLKGGKLTAKQVLTQADLQISTSVKLDGEYQDPIVYDVSVYPAVSHVELYNGETLVNGKTVPCNLVDAEPMVISALMLPEDAMDKPVTWTISDKKEAFATYTIDEETNTVTIVPKADAKPGTVTIKATAADGSKKNATVKVQFATFAKTVTITSTETQVRVGTPLQLNAYTTPEKPTKAGVTWTLKNAADKTYASISTSGKLQGKAVYGETPVTLVATSKDGMASAEYTVTILPKDPGILILKQGTRNVTKQTLNVDQNTVTQMQLSAWNFGTGDQAAVQWKSSSLKAATVDANGMVTILGKGTATITATAADKRKATVTLKIAPAASEVIAQEGAEVASGKSVKLTAQVLGVPKGQVTWSIVSGAEYGKISSAGAFTAVKDITTVKRVTVRATAKDGGAYDDTTVTIRPISQGVQVYTVGSGIQTFSIDSNAGWRVRSNTVLTWDMNQGNTIQLGAHVYPYYGNNNGRNAIQGVKWTSSAKAVATIDENGCVTCLKPGTATITAAAADGSGKKISFKLTVVKTITSLEMANQSVIGGKSLNLTKLITINPADATNKNLDWQIVGGDTSGVTLSKGVLKTPKVTAARILTIRASATDGSGKYVQFSVIVNPA